MPGPSGTRIGRRSADRSRPSCTLQAGQRTPSPRLDFYPPIDPLRVRGPRVIETLVLNQGMTSVVPLPHANSRGLGRCVGDFLLRSFVFKRKVSIPPRDWLDCRLARECYPSSTIMGVPQRQMNVQQNHQWSTVDLSPSSMREFSVPSGPIDPATHRRSA